MSDAADFETIMRDLLARMEADVERTRQATDRLERAIIRYETLIARQTPSPPRRLHPGERGFRG